MSINSDFSKLSLQPIQTDLGSKVTEQQFAKEKQLEAQVIQEMADSSAVDTSIKRGGDLEDLDNVNLDGSKVEEVNVKMRQLSLGVSFELTDTSEQIVKVIDQDTGDLVRQIPTEEFLKMSDRLDEIFGELSNLKGSLINSEV
ncbi:MAG: flagellar biosynthesis protein FlaG [Marinomonas sp.]|nr:flagellar biosynthesis protein FlaG [Marinomonas sp.]